MCKFCENLNYSKQNKMIWNVRSTMANDNIHEFMEENNDYEFVNNQSRFTITGYESDGDIRVGIDYEQVLKGMKIGEVVISPFSEYVHFNYCPMCGKQISKNIKEFTGEGYSLYIDRNEII